MTPISASCSRDRSVHRQSGRVGAEQRAGQQVADDGGKTNALSEVAEKKRSCEPAGEREDQVVTVHRLSV